MDHIPVTAGSQHPEIPLWIDVDGDYKAACDDLLRYPSLKGWNTALFMGNDFTEESHGRGTKEITSFLQMWLYFGVLSSGLGCPIKINDFQRRANHNSHKVLCTRNLHTYLFNWIHESNDLPRHDKIRRLIQLNDAVILICRLLPGIWEGKKYGHSLPPELGLSIATLGVSLGFALPQLILGRDNLDSDVKKEHIRLWGDIWFLGTFLKERFEGFGWCPNDVFRLSKVVSINALCYVATIPRMETVGHLECREDGCNANNIDETMYIMKHVKPDCDCCNITSTSEEVSEY
jgi:hypothetical protein